MWLHKTLYTLWNSKIVRKTAVSFLLGCFPIFLGGCREPSQPDFGRWYRFDAVADEKNQPQSGSELLKKYPIKGCFNANIDFDRVRRSWVLSWTNKRFNWKESLPGFLDTLTDCYRENFRPCTDLQWIQSVKNNANMEAVDTVSVNGVLVSNAALRTLPTDYPCYIRKQGFDFIPLDRLQNSFVNAGTPVYISHYSKDRAWVMIEDVASKAVGFVKTSDVAVVDSSAMKRVSTLPVAVFFKDNQPLYTSLGHFLAYSRLGQVAFVKKETDKNIWILWPKRTPSGRAQWETIRVSKTVASTRPLSFSMDTIPSALDQLLGKPYGWGGTLGNRDCSSMMQDYFRIFGYALPRNSKAQMEEGGVIIDLSGKSQAEKERLIIEKGIPYRTILWAPGHVTLYVGSDKGRVLVAHAKLSSDFIKHGYEGSHIIGKAIVSTLYLDAGIPGLQLSFIDRLAAMTLVK